MLGHLAHCVVVGGVAVDERAHMMAARPELFVQTRFSRGLVPDAGALGIARNFQITRAESHYDAAFARLPAEDRKPQIPGIIMAAIYRTLLDEIRRDGCQVLKHRTSLTPIRKLWIAFRTWVKH